MKVAIVHDWLVTHGGSEKVLSEILKLYPNADLFSLIDFLREEQRELILNKKVTTSFIQNLPFSKRVYRSYLPLMPLAVEQLDLSRYDLVISSSHAVAKGVLTGPSQLHISYVHSPMRYAWDLQHQYLKESNLNKGIKGLITKQILHKMRIWDVRTSYGVDEFIANSQFIAKRIWKAYRRNSTVIYPPVAINDFTFSNNKEDYYLTASRMVPYKKIDLIVEAFNELKDKKLIVIGDGPDFHKIKKKAGGNVSLLGHCSFKELDSYLKSAKAFVFAAEEDFGIIPVEAQACGTPVIAYGKGGVLETVQGLENNNPTGIFFGEQTVSSIVKAIKQFEVEYCRIKPQACLENAKRFSKDIFISQFHDFVQNSIKEHLQK